MFNSWQNRLQCFTPTYQDIVFHGIICWMPLFFINHESDKLCTLLALCEGIPSHKGPVMWSFDISFVVSLNKALNKQSSCPWFVMPKYSCDVLVITIGTPKTKDHQYDNFGITAGTISCHYDNLQCHQWCQSCQINFMTTYDATSEDKVVKLRIFCFQLHSVQPIHMNHGFSTRNTINVEKAVTAFVPLLPAGQS